MLLHQLLSNSCWLLYFQIVAGQVLTVRFDDFFVPVERFFLEPFQSTVTFIITVNIDEAVTFAHLAGTGGYQVDTAPSRIAQLARFRLMLTPVKTG